MCSKSEVITYSISDGAVNSIGTLTVTVLTKNPMKLVFDTTKDNASYSGSGTITEDDTTNTKVSLPLGGAKDVYVDWGDGTSLQKVTTEGDIDYIYSSESTYTVKFCASRKAPDKFVKPISPKLSTRVNFSTLV